MTDCLVLCRKLCLEFITLQTNSLIIFHANLRWCARVTLPFERLHGIQRQAKSWFRIVGRVDDSGLDSGYREMAAGQMRRRSPALALPTGSGGYTAHEREVQGRVKRHVAL